MKKRIKVLMLVAVMLFCMIMPVNQVQAATGKTTLAVSAGTLDIGDTVKITAKAVSGAGGSAYATMTLSYDPSILQFVSCSATYGGGNGSISVSIDKFTVELKAIAAGKCPVYLNATDGVDFSSGEELSSMEGTSTNITVNNAASNNESETGNTGSTNNGNTTGNTGSTNNGGGAGNTGNTNNEDAAGNAGSTNNGGNTNTEVKLSADNSLKSLTISPGTLSPAFKGSTVNYTATVANDVTNVAVNAVVVNAKATVESVTGNTDLKVGQNAIKIVVKAENGTTATYTIKVTREDAGASLPSNNETQEPALEVQNPDSEAQNPAPEAQTPDSGEQNPSGTGMIMFDNSSYEVVKEIPAEVIPKDFSKAVVNYQGIEHQGLKFEKGTLSMLYLKKSGSADQEGRFVVYDETRDVLYPFVRLENGNNYVVALMAPVDTEVPDTYTNTSFSLGGSETVSAFQLISEEAAAKEFYLFYGVNQDGNEGWYQYDSAEGVYQRTLNGFSAGNGTVSGQYEYLENEYGKLKETYQKEKAFSRNVIYILIFTVVILLVLLINIIMFFRKKNRKKAEQEDKEIFDFNDEN